MGTKKHSNRKNIGRLSNSIDNLIVVLLNERDKDLRCMALSRTTFEFRSGEEDQSALLLGIVLALNDESREVREFALQLLRERSSELERIPDPIRDALESGNSQLRLQAILQLATLLPAILGALLRLQGILDDSVRPTLRKTLAARIPGRLHLEALIKFGKEEPVAADRFDAEYPEELPDRLDWLENRLGVIHSRLLRLIGISGENLRNVKAGWQEIATLDPHSAERVEHLLTHYLSYFDYDTNEAARFSRRLPERVKSGEVHMEEYIPDYRDDSSQVECEEALIKAILEEGPGLLPALALFLYSPALPSKPEVMGALPH
jgi:hypothetical protein